MSCFMLRKYLFRLLFSRIILEVFRPKKAGTEEKKQFFCKMLQILETQYPNAFDMKMSEILKKSPSSKENRQQKSLRKLLENSMDSAKSLCVFEKLYHPNPQFRKQAIKHLIKNYSTLKDRQREQIKTYFLDRLNDDSCEVVKETLNISRKILPDVIEESELKKSLVKLINRVRSTDGWNGILFPVLRILCSHFEGNDVEIFMSVLPFLLPISDFELSAAKLIASTSFGQNCELIKPILSQLAETTTAKAFFDIVSANLTNIKHVFDINTFLIEIKNIVTENSTALDKYLTCLLLSNFLPAKCKIETSALVFDIFLFHFSSSKMISVDSASEAEELISCAKKGKFPLEGFLLCLQNVVVKTEKPSFDLIKLDFTEASSESRFFRTLLEIFFKPKQKTYNELYTVCFSRFGLNTTQSVELLLNFCAAPGIDDSFKLKCLPYIQTLLKTTTDLNNKILPYTLAVAYNREQEFRKVILELLKTLGKTRGPL